MDEIGVPLAQAGCLLGEDKRHLQREFDDLRVLFNHFYIFNLKQERLGRTGISNLGLARMRHDYKLSLFKMFNAILDMLINSNLCLIGRPRSIYIEPILIKKHIIPYIKLIDEKAFARSECKVENVVWYDVRLLTTVSESASHALLSNSGMTRVTDTACKSASGHVADVFEGSTAIRPVNPAEAESRVSCPSEGGVIEALLRRSDIGDMTKSAIGKIARDMRPSLSSSRFEGEFWRNLRVKAEERGISLRKRGRPSIK